METDIDNTRRELKTKNEVIGGLQKQIDELRGFEQFVEFKQKFEDTSTELDKEKERLTKLFRLYEETESENKELKENVRSWQNWFASNEGLFTKLFSSVEQLKHSSAPSMASMIEDEQETSSTQEPTPEFIEKPRRKFRFKK